MEKPTFKNYKNWSDLIDHRYSGLMHLEMTILRTMPNRVILTDENGVPPNLIDVGTQTTGHWTAFTHPNSAEYHYFFANEPDAVFFKLRYS